MYYLASHDDACIRAFLPEERITRVYDNCYVAPITAAEYAYFVLLFHPVPQDEERRGIYFDTSPTDNAVEGVSSYDKKNNIPRNNSRWYCTKISREIVMFILAAWDESLLSAFSGRVRIVSRDCNYIPAYSQYYVVVLTPAEYAMLVLKLEVIEEYTNSDKRGIFVNSFGAYYEYTSYYEEVVKQLCTS